MVPVIPTPSTIHALLQRSAWKLEVDSCHPAHMIEPSTVNQNTMRHPGSPILPSERTERYAQAENTPEKSPISAAASFPLWNVGCRRIATPVKPSAIAPMSQPENRSPRTTTVAIARKMGEV